MIKLILAVLIAAFAATGCMSVPVDTRPVVEGMKLGKNVLSKSLPADARLPRGCTFSNEERYGVVTCEQVRAPVLQYAAPVYVAPVVAATVCGPYGCPVVTAPVVVAPAYSSVYIRGGHGRFGFAYSSGQMFGPPLMCNPWGRCW